MRKKIFSLILSALFMITFASCSFLKSRINIGSRDVYTNDAKRWEKIKNFAFQKLRETGAYSISVSDHLQKGQDGTEYRISVEKKKDSGDLTFSSYKKLTELFSKEESKEIESMFQKYAVVLIEIGNTTVGDNTVFFAETGFSIPTAPFFIPVVPGSISPGKGMSIPPSAAAGTFFIHHKEENGRANSVR